MHSSVLEWVAVALTADDIHGRRVLEVGSFDVNGSARPYIESLGPAQYLGVDAAPGPRVDQVVDCEQLVQTVGDNWDLVASFEMLEHAENWRLCMRQMEFVLRAGGLLLLTTRSPGFPYHGYPSDFWRFTVADMQRIVAALKLEAIAIEDDPQQAGVFMLARKPFHLRAAGTLEDIEVQEVVR